MGRKDREGKILWALLGIFFISIGVLLFLSIISYSPDDPGLNHAIGPKKIQNWVGIFGAYISDALLTVAGICSLLIPAFFILGGIRIAREASLENLPMNLLWLILSVAGGDGFLKFFFIKRSETIFRNGIIGDFLHKHLTAYMGKVGAFLLLFFVFFSFTLLFFGINPYDALVWTGERFADSIVFLKEKISMARERRRKRRERIEELKRRQEETFTPKIEMGKTLTPAPRTPTPTPKTPAPIQLPLIKSEEVEFELPTIDLLDPVPPGRVTFDESDIKEASFTLEKKLRDFGVEGKVVEVRAGPLITVFEFEPAPGIKVSKIVNLADDLALGMKAESVRIVAPIPGKGRVGIEIANRIREKVYLSELISSERFRRTDYRLPVALGKDISGEPVITDLEPMPHLLIAGTTGSGKSVCLHSIIMSLLFKKTPNELRFILIDTKMIELTLYSGIPHLYCEVVHNPREAPRVLKKVLEEMDSRFRVMNYLGARNIEQYNRMATRRSDEYPVVPRIVVAIDEMADLMLTAPKEIEEYVTRLSQMARAAGIHLIAATQRPSVDVVTGVIKANFPARIAFKVVSKIDSRTILDTQGAEHLLGAGDMLFLRPGTSRPQRVHGAYVSHEEIKRVVEFLARQRPPSFELHLTELKEEMKEETERDSPRDERYEEAVEIVKQLGEISISKLQRVMRIGFNRSARIIEEMEKDGIIIKDPKSGKYILNPSYRDKKEEKKEEKKKEEKK